MTVYLFFVLSAFPIPQLGPVRFSSNRSKKKLTPKIQKDLINVNLDTKCKKFLA
jgi:hypothetical protein